MAKTKKSSKKKGLSELSKREASTKKVLNPFEIHVNRQKNSVIGRSLKADRGLPGIARAKALKKRKATLLQEYRGKDKTNKFFDHRIGEKNAAMTVEDKIMARFTAEKMKMHKKKSIFNLADDEVLTHRGQTLGEIEKFDDPRSSDEEDEPGKLDANFVEDAHFGGGVLKRTDENKRSRKDLIEELIAESKKRKAEKQRNREQTIELTEKLDNEWKDLLPIVTASKKGAASNTEVSKPDSYDTVMKQLIFEARGKPSERLKSEEELAKEEKERLEKLEADRVQRMHGLNPSEGTGSSRLRSADDLDDGFEIESGQETMLTYSADGQLQLQNSDSEVLAPGDDENNDKGGSDDDEDDDDDEEEEEDEEDEDGDEKVEEKEDGKEKVKGAMKEEEDAGNESSGDDNLSDLKQSSQSEDDEDVVSENAKKREQKPEKPQMSSEMYETSHAAPKSQNGDHIKELLMDKKKLMEKARKELPYTFAVPATYEELQSTLSSWGPDHQAVIIERTLKCNHPSLAEGNRDKLQELLKFLLQHLNDCAIPDEDEKLPQCFLVLDRLIPHIYDLVHMSPVIAGQSILEVLKEKQSDFRTSRRIFPSCDTLIFLKLISHLFPTSDFRHSVVTPAVVFMEQILWESRVKSRRDISAGLFIAALFLEYSVLSKRFSPAAINFLCGVLYLSIDKAKHKDVQPVPPFKKKGENSTLLSLSVDYKPQNFKSGPLMILSDLFDGAAIDDDFKIRALWTSIKMLDEFRRNIETLDAGFEILKPVSVLTEYLNVELFPSALKDAVSNLQENIAKISEKKISFLMFEKKRPKALRLYEPKIEQVLDCKRHRPMGPEKQEREKLLHRYRREMKGAIREIRRDRTFLTKVKLKHTLKSDMERKQKVREIFGNAAMQQGELNLLKRKKEAKHRH